MNLPTLTIPDIPLPFEIPAMMHPAIVHFAVALPVIIILLELINLVAHRHSIGSISFLLIVLMVIVYLGTYLTGSVDASNAKDAIGPQTKELIDAHKNGGIWLVYGTLAVLVIKLISAAVNKFPARVVFLVVLGLFFWGVISTAEKGGALTYKYGVNVKIPIANTVNMVKENTTKRIEKEAEELQEKAERVVNKVKKITYEAIEKAKNTTHKTMENIKDKTSEVTEAGKKAVESTKVKANNIKKAIDKAMEPAPEPTPENIPVPVETVPAG